MSYQVTDIHGVTRLMPEHRQMVKVLNELYADKEESFSDVILTHRNGHAISLHANGCAVWETPGSEEMRILKDLKREEQLTLWIQLAAGRMKTIESLGWELESD